MAKAFILWCRFRFRFRFRFSLESNDLGLKLSDFR